jgi:hypothetical protein
MRALLLLSALLINLAFANAQVPGYMGKKLSISYTPAFFLSLQPKQKESGDYITVPGLNFRNDVTIDYVISKSVAFGASVKYISTKLNDVIYYTGNYYYGPQKAFTGDVLLQGPAFSFYVKKYAFNKKGFIAPVGFYTKWEVVYGKVAVKSGKLLPPADPGYEYVADISEISSISHQSVFGLMYSYGRQNFINDKIFINTSSSIGIGNMRIRSSIGKQYPGYTDFAYDMSSRLGGYLLFNFNIGIGVLL